MIKKVTMSEKYSIYPALSHITLNGTWDDHAWRNADTLELIYFMGDKPRFLPRVLVKVLYDAEALHAMFRVSDASVRAVHTVYQSPVCEDSCIEFFFTPGTDASRGYFNLEINCCGTSLFKHQTGRNENVRPVSASDAEKIAIYHSIQGTIDPEITAPAEWIIQWRLPFKILKNYTAFSMPEPGTAWKGNFYKCGDCTSNPHWLTWSEINKPEPDFHRPDFFGTLVFG
jgi:hypothetical protein